MYAYVVLNIKALDILPGEFSYTSDFARNFTLRKMKHRPNQQISGMMKSENFILANHWVERTHRSRSRPFTIYIFS